MNSDTSSSTAFVGAVLSVALIVSIAVACGTSLSSPSTRPATAATQTPAVVVPTQTATIPPAATATPSSPTPTATAVPPTDTPVPPTNTPSPSPTVTTAADEGVMTDARHGQELFNNLGCIGCHGLQGEGGIGPTIAQTELSLERVVRQYRGPYRNMPRFGPDQVSETDIADIYAFLHTLPTPGVRVPSVLANVTPEVGIGTVRGTIRYRGTGEPAVDEQIYLVPAQESADGSLTFSYLPHLPAGQTDAQGRFEIGDIEARLYAVFYTRQEAPVRDTAGRIVLVNLLPGGMVEVEGFIPPP